MLTPGRYPECPMGYKCREDWKNCSQAEDCKERVRAWKWPPYEETEDGIRVKLHRSYTKCTAKQKVIEDLAQSFWAEAELNPTCDLKEDIKLWRDLCEELHFQRSGYAYPSELGFQAHPAWELFGNSQLAQSKRDWLREKHQISLIYYRSSKGWCLKKDWQLQLEKLESIYGVAAQTKYAKEYAAEEKKQKLLIRPEPTPDEPYLSYEELDDWRSIVEFWLSSKGRFEIEQYSRNPGLQIGDFPDRSRKYLLPGDNPFRQHLWKAFRIQLIYYSHDSKTSGWWLRNYYEEQIFFLEQVVLLDKYPLDLPTPWRDISGEELLLMLAYLEGK